MAKIFDSIVDLLLIKTKISTKSFSPDKQSNKLLKILSAISLFVSVCGLSYYASEAFIKWKISPDIAVTIKQKSSREFPLPAITICSPIFPEEIQINHHVFIYLSKQMYKSDYNLTQKEQNYLALVIQTCGYYPEVKNAIEACPNRTNKNIVKLLKSAHFKTYYFSTAFREIIIGDETKMFSQSLTDYGICKTFNIQGYHTLFKNRTLSKDFDIFKRKGLVKFPYYYSKHFNEFVNDENDKVQWTLENGYKTEIDEVLPIRAAKKNVFESGIAFDSMFYCANFGKGYKLIIHKPNEIPTPFHNQFFVEFLSHVTFKIDAKSYAMQSDLKKFSPSTRRCYFNGEKLLRFFKTYTKSHCDYECLTNFTLKECNCVKFSMPRDRRTQVCDLNKVNCYRNALNKWMEPNDKEKNVITKCDCLPTCNDIQYKIDVARQSSNFYEYDEDKKRTHTHFAFEISKYYFEENENYVSYKLQNFIADCGGLIGLFLGVSLLSTSEFLYNLIMLCIDRRRNNDIGGENWMKSCSCCYCKEKKLENASKLERIICSAKSNSVDQEN